MGPAEALKLGMVDAVVPAGTSHRNRAPMDIEVAGSGASLGQEGLSRQRRIIEFDDCECDDFRAGAIAAKTQYNYPAPIAILDCIFEGTMMPFDKALRLESKYFAKLLCDPVSRNLIRTTFINKGEAMKLARRPKDVPHSRVNKLGVLGAGMMGRGYCVRGSCGGHERGAARQQRSNSPTRARRYSRQIARQSR